MRRGSVAIAAVVVAFVLLVLLPYPATLSDPVDDADYYEHTISPASEPAFEDELEVLAPRPDAGEEATPYDADRLETISYEELSPGAKTVFDRAFATEPGSTGQYSYEPTVCREGVRFCPWLPRGELPTEFEYSYSATGDDAAVIVERDGERYLFRNRGPEVDRAHDWDVWPSVSAAVKLTVMVPLAAFVLAAGTGLSLATRRRRLGVALAGIGLTAATISLHAALPSPWFHLAGPFLVAAAICPAVRGQQYRTAAVVLGAAVAVLTVLFPYGSVYTGLDLIFVATLSTVLLSWPGMLGIAIASRSAANEGRSVADGVDHPRK